MKTNRPMIVVSTIAVLVVLWVIFVSLLSVFANGYLYGFQTRIIEVREDEVLVELDRTSRINTSTEYATILWCNGSPISVINEGVGGITKGHTVTIWPFPLPNNVAGLCYLNGFVRYEPIGSFGPTLTFNWQTENFRLMAR